MSIYKEFAEIYSSTYTDYSKKMYEYIFDVFSRFNIKPDKILDIACGDGTFSLEMAKKGYKMTGIDQSEYLLNIAKKNSFKEKVEIDFINLDMRNLTFENEFDMAVCWYDSLNYILEKEDLEKVFKNVYQALEPKSYFIFDMNTVLGLSVFWQKQPVYIQQDTPELLEIHKNKYDYENRIATLDITCFIKKDSMWKRIDETHKEKAYTLKEIRESFIKNGFKEKGCFGNIKEISNATPESRRVWFIVYKDQKNKYY